MENYPVNGTDQIQDNEVAGEGEPARKCRYPSEVQAFSDPGNGLGLDQAGAAAETGSGEGE